jgi:GR25 family glycosyltransferase involved in LPS biosynthesis
VKILNYIDKAFYINLNIREDRRANFEKRVNDLGIPVTRFAAIEVSPEEMENNTGDPRWLNKVSNCITHLAVIKKAQEEGLSNVWIFEDDCTFTENFIEKAQKCVDELKTVEWDMFYFGGEPNKKASNYLDHIVEVNGIYGAHSYLVNHTFYDKILKTSDMRNGIDIVYLNYFENAKKYYLSRELLCLQDGMSESDIWGGKIDRENNYKLAYKLYIDL